MAEAFLGDEALTSDNLQLSRATSAPFNGDGFAVNCKLSVPESVSEYVRDSLAENSRRAYLSDLAQFEQWGGTIPATAELVASYVADRADHRAVATLVRHLAAISKAHRARGLTTPTSSEIVLATMRGIKRRRGRAQRQAAPLLRDDLGLVIDRMDDSIKSVRDRALLLVGFAAALRRSELVALELSDIEHVKQGVVLHIRASKTDQEANGEKIGVPFGRTRWCPVNALVSWLTRARLSAGPIFRPIDRHGQIDDARLSPEAVSSVIKKRVAAAGFDPVRYSGHSLRAGLATSAARAGIASWKIRQQTRHASDAMLARYIRDGELFTDNAAGALL